MGTISVHEFISLDGVFEDPRWTASYPLDPRMGEAIGGVMGGCRAILLGRKTWEMFAPAWSVRTADEDPGAPFMNDTEKFVVTSGRPATEWRNSTFAGAYSADTIRELKGRVEGGIYVSGSGTLVRAMLADGLVDELHLFVYPVVLGSGAGLFADGGAPISLALKGCDGFSNGVVHLTYGPGQPATAR